MKSKIVLLLILMMACFMGPVMATSSGDQYANDKSVVLSVEVPTPTYTVVIPENTSITFGNTGDQEIGDVYVTDVSGFKDGQIIRLYVSTTEFIYSDTSAGVPDLKAVFKLSGDTFHNKVTDNIGSKSFPFWTPDNPNRRCTLTVQVPDWSETVPGIYNSTVTFHFYVVG